MVGRLEPFVWSGRGCNKTINDTPFVHSTLISCTGFFSTATTALHTQPACFTLRMQPCLQWSLKNQLKMVAVKHN